MLLTMPDQSARDRPRRWAPAALGDAWDALPDELRSRWSRMLVHARRARLLAYRVIATQQTGDVRPGDTAAYRIAVTRLDQESAEVLMDIAAELPPDDPQPTRGDLVGDHQVPIWPTAGTFRRAIEDHHRYSVSATVASGSIEMQRILLARALLAAS